MKTARLTLLLTPQEKRKVAAQAKRAGLSASEYVRRAIETSEADRTGAGPDKAFDALMAREDERLEALRAYLQEGRDAIARGQGIALANASAIDNFFDGRKRAR